MNNSREKSWHVGRWPGLAWLETIIKLIALMIGIIAAVRALAVPELAFPKGISLVQFVILVILAVGLLAAIVDRIADREIVAMVFVVINNLGHWGMVLAITAVSTPTTTLSLFAGLMLLGDLVKLWFIRTHQFTVRDYGQRVLIGLTAIYITGYALILFLEIIV